MIDRRDPNKINPPNGNLKPVTPRKLSSYRRSFRLNDSSDKSSSGKALCRKCQQPITFKKLASGKFCPVNLDLTDHWDTCKAVTAKSYTGPHTQFFGRTVD